MEAADLLQSISKVTYVLRGTTTRLVEGKYLSRKFTYKGECFVLSFLPAIHLVEYDFFVEKGKSAYVDKVNSIDIYFPTGKVENFKF